MIPLCYFCKTKLIGPMDVLERYFQCPECINSSYSKFQVETYPYDKSNLLYIYVDLGKFSIATWLNSNVSYIYNAEGMILLNLPTSIDVLSYNPQELFKKIELYVLMS